jgi:hypothetical protein
VLKVVADTKWKLNESYPDFVLEYKQGDDEYCIQIRSRFVNDIPSECVRSPRKVKKKALFEIAEKREDKRIMREPGYVPFLLFAR